MGSRPPVSEAAINYAFAPVTEVRVVEDLVTDGVVESATRRLAAEDPYAAQRRRGSAPPSRQMIAQQQAQPLPTDELNRVLAGVDFSTLDPRIVKAVADRASNEAARRGLYTNRDLGLSEDTWAMDDDENEYVEDDTVFDSYDDVDQYGGSIPGAI
jgi:hypothetical protein